MEMEPTASISPRPPRTYHYSKPARHDKRADRKPAQWSFAAQLSGATTQLIQRTYRVVDYISRTYRYLKAARENERAVRKPSKISFAAELSAARAQLMEGIYIAAHYTSRTYRHLQAVREYDRAVPKDADTITYVQYLWRRILLGFWPEKIVFGSAAIFKGCVCDAGMGKCWPTVGYVVAFLLMGPVYALVDAVILALER